MGGRPHSSVDEWGLFIPLTCQSAPDIIKRIKNMKKVIALATILFLLGSFFHTAEARNRFPVWERLQNQSVRVGQTLRFTARAVDPDGDALNYYVLGLPHNAGFNYITGEFVWSPNLSQTGGHTIIFKASDGAYGSEMRVVINVLDNQVVSSTNSTSPLAPPPAPTVTNAPAPVFIDFNPSSIAFEGVLYNYVVRAVSNNGGVVTYRLIAGPSGMFVNNNSGVLAWVPNYNHGRPEPYGVIVGAFNGQVETTRTFYINVQNVTPPTGGNVAVISPGVTNTGSVNTASAQSVAKKTLNTSNIVIEAKNNGNIIVSWETNLLSRSRVIYDVVSQADKAGDYTYANATDESGLFLKKHEANLGKLKVGETYYFRTVSRTENERDISPERIFVRLSGGEVEDLGLASALATIGRAIFNPTILFIAVLILSFMLYRARNKVDEL